MVKKPYIPDRGDIVWVDLNPTKGREQANYRPALVFSPKDYNKKTGMMIVCPLTTKIKGYPFEVVLTDTDETSAVLVDQIRTLDWHARDIKFWRKAGAEVFREAQAKLET